MHLYPTRINQITIITSCNHSCSPVFTAYVWYGTNKFAHNKHFSYPIRIVPNITLSLDCNYKNIILQIKKKSIKTNNLVKENSQKSQADEVDSTFVNKVLSIWSRI